MTCSDCGREVHNWPSWLTGAGLKVRCDRCSGNGFNIVSADSVRLQPVVRDEPVEPRDLVQTV
jgi:Zn finger protein HypA/HybF involved in hydrogenase expression